MTLSRRELLKRASAVAGVAAVAAACGPPTQQPPLRPPPPPSGPRTIVVMIGDDMRFDYRTVLRNLDSRWVDCVNAAVEVPMCGPSRAADVQGHVLVADRGDRQLDHVPDERRRHHRHSHPLPRLQDRAVRQVPERLPVDPAGYRTCRPAGTSGTPPGRPTSSPGGCGPPTTSSTSPRSRCSTPRASTPLFLWVAPTEPHLPANPPARYANAAVNLPPKSPAFNEADVSDKPANQQFPLLSASQIATIDRDRLGIGRCLLGVNDGIGELMNALSATGRLNSAHMFFTSDNGYLLGEHRQVKKGEPYEEPSRLPFMVRWPGVAGRTERNLISSVDLSATLCGIAGTTPPGSDGRNLAPLITTGAAVRDAAYIEPPGGGNAWRALRTTRYKYVEYGNGGRELYDLAGDPAELNNVYFSPAYQSTVASLSARLQTLRP